MDSSFANTTFLSKVQTIESTLCKCLDNFRGLVLDFQKLYTEYEDYKTIYVTQKELCERSNCSSSESLKNKIESKDKIIQSLASLLTRLNETKNFCLIDEAFRIICGDPVSEHEDLKKYVKMEPKNDIEKSIKSIAEDVSIKEESLNEIEGTPTGRKSPIIQSKKLKNRIKPVEKSSDHREKTKCPDNWSMSENKSIKLLYLTPKCSKPGSRLRQSRLNIVNVKHTEVIDLTHSPQLSAGKHCSEIDNQEMQPLMKKEPLENDIILPSPTSESINFFPLKVKKNSLSLKNKKGNGNKINLIGNTENEPTINLTVTEDSINILNQLPKRIQNDFEDPIKMDSIDYDETHYETNLSMNLLEHYDEQEMVQTKQCSPTKRPLEENINIVNTPPKKRDESCENHAPKPKTTVDNVKRHIPELAESLYKEPTVRKKSEKLALPGWLCDKCQNFFGDIYKDDPEKMAKRIAECSKHRGKHNPKVPQATSNFWNPRWTAPQNTEELNLMNDAS